MQKRGFVAAEICQTPSEHTFQILTLCGGPVHQTNFSKGGRFNMDMLTIPKSDVCTFGTFVRHTKQNVNLHLVETINGWRRESGCVLSMYNDVYITRGDDVMGHDVPRQKRRNWFLK